MDLIALLSQRLSFILFSENQRKESTACEEKLSKKSNYNSEVKLAQNKKIASCLPKTAQKVASFKI